MLYEVTPSVLVISSVENALMKVYGFNGTLLKATSFPDNLQLNSTTDIAQLAIILIDNTIRKISASMIFTDPSKSINYSDTLNVKLGLRQIIQPMNGGLVYKYVLDTFIHTYVHT